MPIKFQQSESSKLFLNRQKRWKEYTQEKQERLKYTANIFQKMLKPGSNLHSQITGVQQTIM